MIIDPQKIIINRRDLRGRGDGLLSAGLILAFWGLMLYLARPLAAFTGWAAAGPEAAAGDQLAFPPDFLARCLPLIAGLCLSLAGWAWYNRLRFGGARDQRRGAEAPTLPLREIASGCPFGEKEVRLIRQAPVSFFFFDDKGEVIAVKCRSAAADTDQTLAEALALAPRVAAGLDLTKNSEAARVPVDVERPEMPAPPRVPVAPLARPLRPVAAKLAARPLRPVPAGMEGLLVSRPRPVPASMEDGVVFQPLPLLAAMAVNRYSGGVSPEL